MDRGSRMEKQGCRCKGWMVFSICLIIIVLGLGTCLFLLGAKYEDNEENLVNVQSELSSVKEKLDKYRELTETEEPEEVVDTKDLTDMFEGINTALNDRISSSFLVSLDGAFIKKSANEKYQIASFGVAEIADDSSIGGGGFMAFLYRELPDGEWAFSNFSGQAVPNCDEVTEAEIEAFDGVLECTPVE